jgi:hypothetical protein
MSNQIRGFFDSFGTVNVTESGRELKKIENNRITKFYKNLKKNNLHHDYSLVMFRQCLDDVQQLCHFVKFSNIALEFHSH